MFVVQAASACQCSPRCYGLKPDPSWAVFIGDVQETYPESEMKLAVQLKEFLSGRPPGESVIQRHVAFFSALWGAVLTPEERGLLNHARQPLAEDVFGAGVSAYAQRVRLRVAEAFSNTKDGDVFELFSQLGECSPAFDARGRYVVFARPGRSGRWVAQVCLGTALLDGQIAVQQVVADLRAGKSGRPRPPHVYGFGLGASQAGLPVHLLGDSLARSTLLDARGQFVLENLMTGHYRIWFGARDGVGAPVDLIQSTCRVAFGFVPSQR